MGKEKKNASLLYNIYQKYKESKSVSSPEPDTQEPVTEPILSATVENESPSHAEEDTAPSPLDSLLEFYKTFIADYHLSENPNSTITDLRQWMFSPIHNLILYENRKQEIEKATEDICVLADRFWEKIQKEEETYQHEMAAYHAAIAEQVDSDDFIYEPVPPSALNAHPVIITLPDKMAALLFVFPPYREGDDITDNQIFKLLSEKKVSYGVNQQVIEDLVEKHLYMQLFLIAEGTPLTPSRDGEIVHHFKTDNRPEILQDEHGFADFRNLNIFQTITAGTAICDIIPPDKGTTGHNIYGVPLMPKLPKNPPVPRGNNTYLSEDETQLMAACDGHLNYRGKTYHVEPVLQIKENVDYSIGNIDFPGDVIVNGDVLSGFEIKAQGNILIRGMAESAFLSADGDITIIKGMNGNESGTIDAKGSIKASFLENCTINSCGPIYANTIISCEIHCEDTVYAQGNQGAIIGGTITSLNAVEARMIGSKSLRKTTIILGELPRILSHKNELKLEQVETKTIIDKLAVNITYLDKFKASLPVEKLSMLEQLREQYHLYLQKEQKLEKELFRLENSAPDFSHCYVKCSRIFPSTYLHIGGEFILIDEVISQCCIRLGEEGFHMETY